MNRITIQLLIILAFIVQPIFVPTVLSRDSIPAPKLFIGGGSLQESIFEEFLELTGPDARLVVVPTASSRDIDEIAMEERWETRGFSEITILHTNDPEVASSDAFVAPLKTATAVWFNGGSQQRLADAYYGTNMEKELYNLMERGGIIGGSSAGAAIQTKVMIKGGRTQPEISTGFDILPRAIIDQHFLKRNRLSRLIEAVRMHPERVGFGIDEGTAIIVNNNEYKVVGQSYVIRIELVNGVIKIDAFEDGDIIPSKDGQID